MKKILDLKQLCTYLGISDSGARKIIKESNIPYFCIGNRYRFDLDEINNWIEQQQEEITQKRNCFSELELNML